MLSLMLLVAKLRMAVDRARYVRYECYTTLSQVGYLSGVYFVKSQCPLSSVDSDSVYQFCFQKSNDLMVGQKQRMSEKQEHTAVVSSQLGLHHERTLGRFLMG